VLGIGPAPSNLIDQVTGDLSLLWNHWDILLYYRYRLSVIIYLKLFKIMKDKRKMWTDYLTKIFKNIFLFMLNSCKNQNIFNIFFSF
jgi:hypothetical protein